MGGKRFCLCNYRRVVGSVLQCQSPLAFQSSPSSSRREGAQQPANNKGKVVCTESCWSVLLRFEFKIWIRTGGGGAARYLLPDQICSFLPSCPHCENVPPGSVRGAV
jgi:hypothetical protein